MEWNAPAGWDARGIAKTRPMMQGRPLTDGRRGRMEYTAGSRFAQHILLQFLPRHGRRTPAGD